MMRITNFTRNIAKPIKTILLIVALLHHLLFAGMVRVWADGYTCVYDHLNRLVKVIYNNGTVIEYGYDAAGNRLTLRVTSGGGGDITPPETTISSPTNGQTVTTNSITASWTGSDNVTAPANLQFSYQLDTNAWSTYSNATTATLNNLSNGSHALNVKAKDQASNEDPTPATVSFTVTVSSGSGTNLAMSTSSLSFGSIVIGQTSSQNLIITNQSSSTGTLTGSFGNPTPPFVIVSGGGSFSLTPGQSRTIGLQFAPTSAGNFTGVLPIFHNATNQTSPSNVSLSGAATSTGGGTPPVISGISPNAAPVNGAVTISGTNFTEPAIVRFNSITATSVTLLSPNQIATVVPIGATTGPVEVTTSAGTAVGPNNFLVQPAVCGALQVTRTIPISGTESPFGIAALQDGSNRVVVSRKNKLTFVDFVSGVETQSLTFTDAPTGEGRYIATFGNDVFTALCSTSPGRLGKVNLQTNAQSVIGSFNIEPTGIGIGGPLNHFYLTHNVDSGTVTVMDSSNYSVVATIPIGQKPNNIIIYNSKAYITCYGNPSGTSGSVIVLDLTNNSVVKVIPLPAAPTGAITVLNGKVFVATQASAAQNGTLYAIDIQADTLLSQNTQLGRDPLSLAVFGNNLVVSCLSSNTVSVIDPNTGYVMENVTVSGPIRLTVDRLGSTYVLVTTSDRTVKVLTRVTPQPTITNFVPSSGPVGTTVTLTGTNLSCVRVVGFGNAQTLPTSVSDTSLTTTVPAGATSGPITLFVTGSMVQSSANFTVTSGAQPPTIASFGPTTAPVGTKVVINGTNFNGATSVQFNSTPATNVTVNSPTQITAFVPTSATTGPIRVTTPGGTGTSTTSFTVSQADGSTTSRYIARLFNIDDVGKVILNGNTVLQANYNETRELDISSQMVVGSNTVRFTVENTGDGFTFGFTLLKDGQTIFADQCGTASVQGCNNNSNQTGTVYDLAVPVTISGPPAPAPVITSFSPTSGPVGTTVTIAGSNLTGASSVKFNATNALTFNVVSASQITATVPVGATTGRISVTTSGGTATSSSNFTVTVPPPPSVSSFSPTSGPVGTVVTINGANFTGATSVKFNLTEAPGFTVASASQIRATVPAGATTGRVSVTTPNGTGQSAGSFSVTVPPPPSVSSFSPTSGPVGTVVTINGANFTGATSVKFNLTEAPGFTVVSASQIRATVPTGASTGKISVTTPNGLGQSAGNFTVTIPSITSFSPTSGPIGTVVTINGTNFTGATSVKFHLTEAPGFTVVSSSQIRATVPAGAITGKISVTTPSGTGQSPGNFSVTTPAPTISSFTPTSGSIGALITITGTNFTGVTGVRFNLTNATQFTIISATQIQATVPAGATTGRIYVSTPGGTAGSLTNFTVTGPQPPTITSFTPTSGGVGTTVIIDGTDFVDVQAVSIKDWGIVGLNSVSPTRIICQVPGIASAGPGPGPIMVRTTAGTAYSATNFDILPDTTPPETTITSTNCGQTVAPGSSVTINWVGSDNAQGITLSYSYQINDGDWSAFSHLNQSVTITNALPGTYIIRARARDYAQNEDPTPAECRFHVPIDTTQTYKLVAKHSNQCLDVNGASTSSGAQIIQQDCHDGNNQKWKLVSVDGGYYELRPQHTTNQCLTVASSGTSNGTQIVQSQAVGAEYQKWTLTPQGNGYYKLIAKHSGKSADVSGGNIGNGITLVQWDGTNGDNQKFLLQITTPAPQNGVVMPNPHTEASAVVLNGRIHVIGGFDSAGDSTKMDVFDPLTGTWSPGSEYTDGGQNSSVVVNNQIYSFLFYSGACNCFRNGMWIFNPAANTWTFANAPYQFRAADKNAITYNGNVFLVGGWRYCFTTADNFIDQFNPAGNSWQTAFTTIPSNPEKLTQRAIASIGNKIYVIGGSIDHGNCGPFSYYSNVYEYNVDTTTWTQLASLPVALDRATAVSHNGKIYVVGGRNENANALSSVYVYDPANTSWSTYMMLLTPRSNPSTVVYNNTLFVLGGRDLNGGVLNSVELIPLPSPSQSRPAEAGMQGQPKSFPIQPGNPHLPNWQDLARKERNRLNLPDIEQQATGPELKGQLTLLGIVWRF